MILFSLDVPFIGMFYTNDTWFWQDGSVVTWAPFGFTDPPSVDSYGYIDSSRGYIQHTVDGIRSYWCETDNAGEI